MRSNKSRLLLAACGFLVFMGILLLLASFYGFQRAVLTQQKEQMLVIAKSTAKSIDNYLDGCLTSLHLEAETKAFRAAADAYLEAGQEDGMLAILQKIASEEHPAIVDAALLDADNRIRLSSSPPGSYTLLTAADEQVPVYRRGDGGLYLGLVLDIGRDTRFLALLDIDRMYRSTASFVGLGDKGYVMIKHANGLILMHPVEEQIGGDVIEGRQERYPDLDYRELERLIANQKSGREGIEIYHSYWWADETPTRVRKVSAYTPAAVQDSFLIISAVTDYAELLRPVWVGTAALTLAAILITSGMIAAVLLARRRQHQIERENLYLRDMNRSLEDMNKQMEHMQHDQRLQMIGTLAGGIAHEFSNLLTPIMGYSGLLMESLPPDDPNREDIEEIYNSSVKAKEIIGQITALSRKNMESKLRPLSLDETIPRILRVAGSVKPENVRLVTDIRFEGASILGNSTQMNQIILNLCTNAFQAMENREGELRITGLLENRGGIQDAVLAFTDNGKGIDADILPRIFDPFFTTKRAGEGTGLGLSIVQNIVELHGGNIHVDSAPGKGATFTLRFPTILAEAMEESAPQESPLPDSTLDIVLVEDNEAVLQTLRRGLERNGYRPRTFTTPAQALEALVERPCDLLITDSSMPGMTGAELAMRVKGAAGRTKVLLLTGFPEREILEYMRREILDGYLVKPVTISALLGHIRELF